MVYYNENDKRTCDWLRELIKAKQIPDGHIDTRSIKEIDGEEIRGYNQYHFFAGIGGWPYALQLAGWPDNHPVITGSCPCQPFSTSALGKNKGFNSEKHLWPDFARIISKLEISIVFGEQVASKLGRQWLGGVLCDLEALGFTAGAADLCAAGIGASHQRQRIYWTAFKGLAYPAMWARHSYDKGNFTDLDRTITSTNGHTRKVKMELEVFPFTNGFPENVGLMRGYGNAIVPQLAAEFIKAGVEAMKDLASAS